MATVQMGLFDRLRERLAEGSLALALPLLQRREALQVFWTV